MRKDVKLGALAGVFIIVLALWYFGGDDQSDQPVSLSGTTADRSLAANPAGSPASSLNQPKTPAPSSPPSTQPRPSNPARSNDLAASSSATSGSPRENLTNTKLASSGDRMGTSPMKTSSSPSSPSYDRQTGSRTFDDPGTTTSDPMYVARPTGEPEPYVEENDAYGPEDDPSGYSSTRFSSGDSTSGGRRIEQPPAVPRFPFGERITRESTHSPASTSGSSATDHETYTVVAGDTFTSIADDKYGSDAYTKPLIAANPQIKDPNLLVIGMKIKLPPRESLSLESTVASTSGSVQKAIESKTGRTYTVQPGDTLYGIARETLSSGERWREIFDLNKSAIGDNPAVLKVGQVLAIPNNNPT